MKCIERYSQYKGETLDRVIGYIDSGRIACGRYSKLVKINNNHKLKGKVFFK